VNFVTTMLCMAAVVVSTTVTAETPTIEEIVVTAHPLSGEGLSQAADVLVGDELDRKRSSNIGATLAKQPGIHSAQFGKAVGRPIIHGLGGPRVKIMEDRIDTLDVSVSSGDHAVAVEPFIAERIEVLKGASTLLYGSGAIGGVVDVHTGRIPHEVPDKFTGGIDARYDNNTNGNTTTMKLNGGSGRFAWHVDGTIKDGDDYRIPGSTLSARQQALEGEAGARGELPGSMFDSKSSAVGASVIEQWGFLGFAAGRTESEYGLPGDPDGIPVLNLVQQRRDFELGIREPFLGFHSFNFRAGSVDYQHKEIEPSGEVATTFENDAWEARAELVYERGLHSGTIGVQHTEREFSAIGEESFIPPVDTTDTGVFWVGQRSYDAFDLELGLRIGRVEHNPSLANSEEFDTYSASGGLVIPLAEGWFVGLLVDHSARAPVGEELYSEGPHLVTGTFERGNADLDNERATSFSATVQYDGEFWHATATGYYTRFTDFIYQQATGAFIDSFPVLAYNQIDARYLGIDLEITTSVARWDGGEVLVRGMFDLVNAKLDTHGNDNIPRTPPMRYGFGIEANWGRIQTSIDYLRVDTQADIAPLELVTDGYNDISAHVGFELALAASSLNFFLEAKNLSDDEQRIHTSFIKEVAPAPGRSIEFGVRWVF
jgi:iron complex outermembrane receptor protein